MSVHATLKGTAPSVPSVILKNNSLELNAITIFASVRFLPLLDVSHDTALKLPVLDLAGVFLPSTL